MDQPEDSETPSVLWNTLLVDVRIATMAEPEGYGVIEGGAIGIQGGRIAWVGTMGELPADATQLANDVLECGGRWVTPGLIDCHNHAIAVGHYRQPLPEIVEATRIATEEELLEASGRRLVSLLEEGVTAVGITSGYGLDAQTEEKIAHVVPFLEEVFPMHFLTKLEGLRTLPEAYAGHKDAFSVEGVRALVEARQAALLLPGVFYTLGLTQKPLVDMLRQANIPMLLATDCNPVTSPVTSLLLVMNMACRFFGLTPLEALHGVTHHAARALGVDENIGTVAAGKLADLALWDITHPDELSHELGYNPCLGIIKGGVLRRTRE